MNSKDIGIFIFLIVIVGLIIAFILIPVLTVTGNQDKSDYVYVEISKGNWTAVIFPNSNPLVFTPFYLRTNDNSTGKCIIRFGYGVPDYETIISPVPQLINVPQDKTICYIYYS
jgi:hypothetical protein